MIELRPYQHLAIENLRVAIRSCTAGYKRILLQAATGSGKTIVACEMIRLALGKDKRALFIAHRKEIILQSSRKSWMRLVLTTVLLWQVIRAKR
jgi:superfamily II DNA or RNA helicase